VGYHLFFLRLDFCFKTLMLFFMIDFTPSIVVPTSSQSIKLWSVDA